MSAFTFAFRRMTPALLVPVVNVPTVETALEVPDGYIQPSYKAFAIYNPNKCAVALRGTSYTPPNPRPTTPLLVRPEGIDWVFPPDFWSVFSTQNPAFVSACAVWTPNHPDLPPDEELVPLRLWYGSGT